MKITNPIARKEHTCNYCKGIIQIGQRYVRGIYFNKRLYEWKAHAYCENLAVHIANYYNEEITEHDFRNYIKEAMYGHICKGCVFAYNQVECLKNRELDFCYPYILNYYNISHEDYIPYYTLVNELSMEAKK